MQIAKPRRIIVLVCMHDVMQQHVRGYVIQMANETGWLINTTANTPEPNGRQSRHTRGTSFSGTGANVRERAVSH